jgi:hypothetical protein
MTSATGTANSNRAIRQYLRLNKPALTKQQFEVARASTYDRNMTNTVVTMPQRDDAVAAICGVKVANLSDIEGDGDASPQA